VEGTFTCYVARFIVCFMVYVMCLSLLAADCWLLPAGCCCWLLLLAASAAGCWLLAAGCWLPLLLAASATVAVAMQPGLLLMMDMLVQ
jgi:hypothetical protein